MAERYTRLYLLSENLYTPGAPVVIAAGALLKDNQTGKTLAQLKFKSLSNKIIKALKVSVAAFDVSGNALAGVDERHYLDLAVERDEEFGQKQAIFLPDAVTRSIVAQCTEVIFEDGTAWKATEDVNWNALPEQKTIDACLKEFAAQYQRDTSRLSKYVLLEHENLWLCTCGAVNNNEESECHRCNYSKAELLEAMDLDGLQERKAEYDRKVAEEAEIRAKQAAERAEKKAAEDKVRHAKMKKISIIAAAVVAVIVAAWLTLFYIFPKTTFQYHKAYSILMNEGNGATEKQKEAALGIVIETCRQNRAAWSSSHVTSTKEDYKTAVSFEDPIIELPDITFENKNVENAFLQYKYGAKVEKQAVRGTYKNDEWAQNYAVGAMTRYEALLNLDSEGIIKISDEEYEIYANSLILSNYVTTITSQDWDDETYAYIGNINNLTPATLEGITVTLSWSEGSLSSDIEELSPDEGWQIVFLIPDDVPSDTNFDVSMEIEVIHH